MRIIGTVILFLGLIDLHSQDSTGYWQEIYQESSSNYRFAEAIDAAENWARMDTSGTTALYELCSIYIKAGNHPKAMRALENLFSKDSLHIPGLNQLARLHSANQNTAAALNIYEKLMVADSTNPYYVRKAAGILLSEKKQELRTFTYMNRALELNPADVNLRIEAARFYMEGRAFYIADTLLTRALAIDSTHQVARLVAAQSAFLQNDPDDVVRLLKGVEFDAEHYIIAARYYGISLYNLNEFTNAVEVLKTIPMIDEKVDYPHYYIGLSYIGLGMTTEAIQAFKMAIEKATSPNLTIYYEQLGQAQKSTGQHEKAIVSLRQARFLNEDKDILFKLAESYDAYYADKTIALKMYAHYLEADTTENENTIYARSRMEEIGKELHFNGKSE